MAAPSGTPPRMPQENTQLLPGPMSPGAACEKRFNICVNYGLGLRGQDDNTFVGIRVGPKEDTSPTQGWEGGSPMYNFSAFFGDTGEHHLQAVVMLYQHQEFDDGAMESRREIGSVTLHLRKFRLWPDPDGTTYKLQRDGNQLKEQLNISVEPKMKDGRAVVDKRNWCQKVVDLCTFCHPPNPRK
eukprot:TRINITY_DN1438_c0_g1_i1.p1 TRINITY_DN1438_c0_g1~~TRINITY_DN1438_c0_g1_i1.p1  ORF type:complete len:217 (+),score=49.01 TRINITY_DN1438_c0_g1_i1:98-652(+)